MKTQSTAKKLSLGLLGITAGLAMSVQAERYGETIVSTSAEGVRVATISFAGLDLGSTAGLNTVTNRVRSAARLVCGPTDYRRTGSLSQARDNRQCATSAFESAMSQLHGTDVAVVEVSAPQS